MKTYILAIAFSTACCFALWAEDEEEKKADAASADTGFERYQSIIDRQPFGPPPPGFDPTQPPGKGGAGGGGDGEGGRTEAEISAEEQKLMSSVRVSILNVTPAGAVMAGFTDSTTQPPVNYYLKVGDTSTDAAKWTVKDADPAAGTVTLSKDGIDVTLSVGGETKKGAAGKGGAKGPGVAADDQQRGRGFLRRLPMPPPAATGGPAGGLAGGDAGEDAHGGSLARLRQRRMLRQAEEVAQRQAAEKARAAIEEQERAEREREREQAAADREQQREALMQIQEELRRRREAEEAAKKAKESEQQGEEPNE